MTYFISPSLYPEDTTEDPSASIHAKLAIWMGKFKAKPNTKDALNALGIARTDKVAKQTLHSLISELSEHCTFERAGGNATVYFLKNRATELRAVFKLGEKKAAMEVLARKAAHLLGLEAHIPPSMYCALQNLDVNPIVLPKISDSPLSNASHPSTTEEEGETARTLLWNGSAAVFLKQPASEQEKTEFQSAVFGVLQPYIPSREMSKADLDRLVLTCLSLVIRDVNQLGIIGATSIDNEYGFTADSDESDLPAITDLPFLNSYIEELDMPINGKELHEIVGSWDIPTIIQALSDEPLQYFDSCLNNVKQGELKSEGYLQVAVERTINEPYVINDDYIDEEINPNSTILIESQVKTLEKRLQALKTFFANAPKSFTLKDLIFSIDPKARLYYEALKTEKNVFSIVGRQTPPESMGLTDSIRPPSLASFTLARFGSLSPPPGLLKPIPRRTSPPPQ